MYCLSEFCYCCLQKHNCLININNYDFDNVSFKDKLKFCYLHTDTITDDIPKLLCEKCCKTIGFIYKFRKVYFLRRQYLQNYINLLTNSTSEFDTQFTKLSINILNADILLNSDQIFNVNGTQFDTKNDTIIKSEIEDEILQEHNKNNEDCFAIDVQTVNFTLHNPFTNRKEPEGDSNLTKTEDQLSINSVANYEIVKNDEIKDAEFSGNVFNLSKDDLKFVIRKQNFVCHICNKFFPSEYNLNLHLSSHNSKAVYSCIFCVKKFVDFRTFKKHERMHPDKPYNCKVCNKLIKHKRQYRVHMSQHTGIFRYKCNICQKGLASNQNLLNHKLTHYKNKRKLTGKKTKHSKTGITSESESNFSESDSFRLESNFQCKICKKRLSTKQSLLNHKLTHCKQKNNLKLSKTKLSSKVLSTSESDTNFSDSSSQSESKFKCNICKKKLASKQSLLCHKVTHYKQENNLNLTDEKIKDSSKASITSESNSKLSDSHYKQEHNLNLTDRKTKDDSSEASITSESNSKLSDSHFKKENKLNQTDHKTKDSDGSNTSESDSNFSDSDNFQPYKSKFQCDICKKQLSSSQRLLSHKLIHFKQRYNRNPTDDKKTHSSKASITSESNSKLSDSHYKQEHNLNLTDRKTKDDSSEASITSVSDSNFSDSDSFHPEKSKFKCNICKKQLSSKQSLLGHKISHYNKKNNLNLTNYKRKDKSKASITSESNSKFSDSDSSESVKSVFKFQCNICQKFLFSKQNLLNHKLNHYNQESNHNLTDDKTKNSSKATITSGNNSKFIDSDSSQSEKSLETNMSHKVIDNKQEHNLNLPDDKTKHSSKATITSGSNLKSSDSDSSQSGKKTNISYNNQEHNLNLTDDKTKHSSKATITSGNNSKFFDSDSSQSEKSLETNMSHKLIDNKQEHNLNLTHDKTKHNSKATITSGNNSKIFDSDSSQSKKSLETNMGHKLIDNTQEHNLNLTHDKTKHSSKATITSGNNSKFLDSDSSQSEKSLETNMSHKVIDNKQEHNLNLTDDKTKHSSKASITSESNSKVPITPVKTIPTTSKNDNSKTEIIETLDKFRTGCFEAKITHDVDGFKKALTMINSMKSSPRSVRSKTPTSNLRGRPSKIKRLSKKRETCEKCNQSFANKPSLRTHIFQYHRIQKCSTCSKQFKSHYLLCAHKKDNENCRLGIKNKKQVCQICNKTFKLNIQLKHHLKKHDIKSHNLKNDDYKEKCNYCNKTFPNKVRLDLHLLVHTGIHKFRCTLCDHMFSTKMLLENHINRAHNKTQYKCKFCTKSFKLSHNLNKHLVLFHIQESAKLSCDFCDKKFFKLSHLRRHIRSHKDWEKVYPCSECNKVFHQKCNLVRHLVIHTKEMPYECKICKKKFNLLHPMLKHMKAVHNMDRDEI